MAVRFQNLPNSVSRLNNLDFTVSSTKTGIRYFVVQVLDRSNNVVTQLKCVPTPRNRQQVVFRLTNILSNFVDVPLFNDSSFSNSSQLYQYRVRVFEDDTAESNTTSSLFTYCSLLNDVENIISLPGILDGSMPKAIFSNRPENNIIRDKQKELLYFIVNPGTFQLEVIINGLTFSRSLTSSNTISIVNVSLDVISREFGVEKDEVKTFSIQVKRGTTELSKKYHYQVVNTNCNSKQVNLIWSNQYGGYDSFVFLNPVESKQVERQLINRGKMASNNSIIGGYKQVYSSKKESTYTVHPGLLSDQLAAYVSELLFADKVFLYKGNRMIEVELIDTSYQLTRDEDLLIQFKSVSGLFDSDQEEIVDDVEVEDFVVQSFK